MPIQIDPERRARLVASIKRFLSDELDEQVGDLKASLFLDFCLEELGPSIYNQAVADTQAYLQARLDDMPGAVHQPERAGARR